MGRPRKYSLIVPDKIVTEDLAYWVGFVVADGCIWKEHSWRLDINLHHKDREHLQKFLDYLQSDYPIYSRNHGITVGVRINSNSVVDLFREFGVTPRKSYTTRADIRLAFNRHFWRGVFDGDGHLGFKRGRPRFKLVGSNTLCNQFQQFLSPVLDSYTVKDHGTYSIIEGYGEKAKTTIHILYQDSVVALQRKLSLAGVV